MRYEKNGTVANLIVRGKEEEVRSFLEEKQPLLLEILPLSLEEMFLCEMQALGYSYDIEEVEDEEE